MSEIENKDQENKEVKTDPVETEGKETTTKDSDSTDNSQNDSDRIQLLINENKKLKSVNQELAQFRNELKELKQKEAEQKGEYQKLYNEYKEKYPEEKFLDMQERLDNIEKETRQRLLNQLDAEKQERYKDMDLSTLQIIVEDLSTKETIIAVDKGARSPRSTTETKPWDEMSYEEQSQLMKDAPETANKLIRESKQKTDKKWF